jgi:molybdopterin-containing oxidoreductase family membrane subunit
LVVPKWRNNLKILPVACCLVFASTWIDKGLGMIAGGFVPNPLHEVTEYAPTAPELMITLGIWALGALILTVLYKVATGVKEEVEL